MVIKKGIKLDKMYIVGKYRAQDLMSDLICDNHQMLLVMSSFGISFGFGEQSIEEVCQNNGVDTNTFLAVVNLLINDEVEDIDYKDLSVETLMGYLQNSHAYYMNFRLPNIRDKLLETLDPKDDKISILIIRYYDEYIAEVKKHLDYEEQTVFPYVSSLLNKIPQTDYNIDIFSSNHDNIDSKLVELKNIIIKYYPSKGSNELNSVLLDIFNCAEDLLTHTKIEDILFIPLIREIEKKG